MSPRQKGSMFFLTQDITWNLERTLSDNFDFHKDVTNQAKNTSACFFFFR